MTANVTTDDIPEADLADAEYPEQRVCTCHVVREGAGGVSYSDAILGVNCASCDAFMDDCEHVSLWNSLTRDERIAELVRTRNSIAEYEARRAAEAAAFATIFGGEEPPF